MNLQIIMKNPEEERTLDKWKFKDAVDEFEYNLIKKRYHQLVAGIQKLYQRLRVLVYESVSIEFSSWLMFKGHRLEKDGPCFPK